MQLRAAFLATSYGTSEQRFRLAARPGRPCRLFAPGERWAVLTAHNQHGVRQEFAQNERQQRLLKQSLSGFVCEAAVNGEGGWTEASLLVRGITLRLALELGRRHGQAAALWGSGQRAALVWCDPPPGAGQPGPGQPGAGQIERLWAQSSDAD